jgi:hypothetical protein
MRLSWSHNPSREFDKLTLVDSGKSNKLLSQYFFLKKRCRFKIVLNQIIFLLVIQNVLKLVKLTKLYHITPQETI